MQTTHREQRITRQVESVEERNHHEIDNRGQADHVIGVYRYIDKTYEVAVRNYGVRLVLEFIVPEPGANLLHAAAASGSAAQVEKPEEPTFFDRPLRLTDIRDDNAYRVIASRYGVEVEPPPRPLVALTEVQFDHDSAKEVQPAGTVAIAKGSIPVPDTHYPSSVWGRFAGFQTEVGLSLYTPDDTAGAGYSDPPPDSLVGKEYAVLVQEGEMSGRGPILVDLEQITEQAAGPVDFAAVSRENPITGGVHGGGVVEAFCLPTAAAFQAWQVKTFNAIMDAYRRELDKSRKHWRPPTSARVSGYRAAARTSTVSTSATS